MVLSDHPVHGDGAVAFVPHEGNDARAVAGVGEAANDFAARFAVFLQGFGKHDVSVDHVVVRAVREQVVQFRGVENVFDMVLFDICRGSLTVK